MEKRDRWRKGMERWSLDRRDGGKVAWREGRRDGEK